MVYSFFFSFLGESFGDSAYFFVFYLVERLVFGGWGGGWIEEKRGVITGLKGGVLVLRFSRYVIVGGVVLFVRLGGYFCVFRLFRYICRVSFFDLSGF